MKVRTVLLGNAAIYSASNVLNGVSPFLLLPIMTRLLPPQQYGVLAMYTALLSILSAFTGLSVQGAVSARYFQRDEIDFPRYVGATLWVLAGSSVVTFTAMVSLRGPMSRWTSIDPFWLLMAVAVSSINFITQIRLGIWLMAKQPIRYGVLQVGMSAINAALSVALVLWVYRNADGRLWGQTIAYIAFGVISLISLVRGGWVDLRPDWVYMKEVFAFGVPLVPHVIGGFLLAAADRFIVNDRLGLQQAGVYMVAAQLGMGMNLAADAFNKAFVPWLYEKLKQNDNQIRRQIVRGTWLYFAVALVVAGVVALLAPWIIDISAGHRYQSAVPALQWIALGQAFGGMYLMVTNYVFYSRKTSQLAWYTLSSGAIAIAVSWVLTPAMGVAGAGAGLAVGMFVKFALTWRLARRLHPMPWWRLGLRACSQAQPVTKT